MHRVKRIDYDDDDIVLDHNDNADYEGEEEYTASDRQQFATLTPVVRAELQEAPESLQLVTDKEIEDALWHYYWDVGKSVTYLKSVKGGGGGAKKSGGEKSDKKPKVPQKSKFDLAAEKSKQVPVAGKSKPKPKVDGLAKKTEALSLDSTPTTALQQPKIKSQGLNVPKLWMEHRVRRKAETAFVVIGHVDHGKSTLMGRLLLDTGAVSQRDIDKYKKQATEMGKASFALAWVMDTGSEERERGVTVDIAQHHFSTKTTNFTILDAPGHRDFVPNMIGGASMADLALLVVDATQFESGLKGQMREHVILAKAAGINSIIVAVNKLDSVHPPFDQTTFNSLRDQLRKFLLTLGFSDINVAVVPCCGLTGENVVTAPQSPSKALWMSSESSGIKTLLQELEYYAPDPASDDLVTAPLRLQIADVFRGGVQNPLSVSGRITKGSLQIGDTVLLQPSGHMTSIRGIEVGDEPVEWAVAGQIATLHLSTTTSADLDAENLRAGDVIGCPDHPIPVTKSFNLKVHAIEALLPQEVDVHAGRLHVAGRVSQLLALLETENVKREEAAVTRKKPRVVKEGQRAVVRVELASPVPLEKGDRVVLRVYGKTVAAGTVE